jgi:hypothetical protein
MGLGTAFTSLGERESGTGKLEEAVAAHREALKEWTKEAAPYWHNIAQQNLDRANALLAQRRGDEQISDLNQILTANFTHLWMCSGAGATQPTTP